MDYDERLGVPLRWWVQGTMLVATFWLAMVVAPARRARLDGHRPRAGADGARLPLLRLGPDQRLATAVFRAGRARIEAAHLGAATALDADETRRTAGRDADARAYLLLRPYLKRAVRVAVTDPADPAPYWLVSTRHPDQLVAALAGMGRTAAAG